MRRLLRKTVSYIGKNAPWILGAIFLISGGLKIYDLGQFSWYASTVKFLPERYQNWLTFLVPLSEIALGCMLLAPRVSHAGMILAVLMLCIYTTFLLALVVRPYAPDCECFGTVKLFHDAKIENRIALGRNVILLSMAIYSVRLKSLVNATSGGGNPPAGAPPAGES
jgi:hypothetical protein